MSMFTVEIGQVDDDKNTPCTMMLSSREMERAGKDISINMFKKRRV